MDLTQEAAEIVDAVERLRGHDDVTRSRRDVAEVGQVGLQALHGHLGQFGTPPHLGETGRVGIDGDRLRAVGGERDRRCPTATRRVRRRARRR